MRALHFIHTFSKLSETFIYDYVIGLQKQGLEIQVVTFNRVNQKDRPFKSVRQLELRWWNLPRIRNISRDWLSGKNRETSAWPVYRKKLKRMLADDPPQVLHAHFGPMGALLAPVAEELGIPLVVTFYGYDISEITAQSYWQQAYKELVDAAAYVTVLSEEMKERALQLGFSEKQTKVIHLGTDVDAIQYRKPAHPSRKFLSIGRLSGKKGHLDTLKAFSEVLKKTGHQLELNIIGEGEDRPKLEQYIEQHDLQERVHLLGSVAHKKVVEHLQQADAFILNSKTSASGDREGTPTVLVEAQAAGLPCISTFHSGIPEMIPPDNHRFLAEEGNIPQIVKNMERLLSAPASEIEEISQLGRQRVEAEFDAEGEAAKFAELYKQLI